MQNEPNAYQPDLIPGIQYRDARAAIAWLQRTLTFEPHLIVAGEGNDVVHAELRLGRGLFMCGSLKDSGGGQRSPRDVAGANTQACYLARPDVESLYAAARAADAEFWRELTQTDYGSTEFSLRDPEGHLWNIGTYHPTADNPGGGDTNDLPPELYGGTSYDDARAALAFLVRAFGAAEHFVVPGEGDALAHAQVRFGSSIFMFNTSGPEHRGMRTPAEVGGANTQSMYCIVPDVDAHCARSTAAGATIEVAPYDTPYGSRAYAARDLEGHLWHFGTYRPALVPQGEIVEAAAP